MYQTDQITVKNDGTGLDTVLHETERFTDYLQLGRKDALHVVLLTEETLAMVRALIGDHSAVFWIEGNSRKCSIHLTAQTRMDPVKREVLLDVSKSGRNEAAKGIMGKIRDVFEMALENYEAVEQFQMEQGMGSSAMMLSYGMDPNSVMSESMMVWSLNEYRSRISQEKGTKEDAREVWDELEKSIVANIADDVRVGIYKDRVEMVIDKQFVGEGK